MQETLERPKKKPTAPVVKDYEFELIKTHDKYKPVDRDTGKMLGMPYPPYFGVMNSGIAITPDGNTRAWRYIEGQPSIWVDEQTGLKEESEREITKLLSMPENQFEFRNGKLIIRSNQKLKLQAIQLSDIFEGNTNPYKIKPKEFRLNNPDVLAQKGVNDFENEADAMVAAKQASDEDMVAFAFVIGINTDDVSDAGLKMIRSKFYSYAKANASIFLKNFSNPVNKIKYIFAQGLKESKISGAMQVGKLVWVDTNVIITEVKSDGDIAAEMANRYMTKEGVAIKTYDALLKMV